MPASRARAGETASRRGRGADALQRADACSDKSSGSDIVERASEGDGAKPRRRNPSRGRKASGSGSGSRQRSGGSSTSDEGQRDDAGRVTIDDRRLPKRKRSTRQNRPTMESVKRATPPDGSPKNLSDDDNNEADEFTTEDEFGVLSLKEAERHGLKPRDIFGRRVRSRSIEYLVRWEERPHVANAWIPGVDFERTKPELVASFNAAHGDKFSILLVKREWMNPQRVVNVTGAPNASRLLVKWWGLPYADCTWESVEGHKDLPGLLEKYWRFERENLGRAHTVPLTSSTNHHTPNDVVQSISRWLRATWLENEGVCLVDNSPRCNHSEITATFIRERKLHHKTSAPTLIIVAENQLNAWSRDFARFAPDLNVVAYGGSAVCRVMVQQHEWLFGGLVAAGEFEDVAQPRFHVLLTTPSTVTLDIVLLRQVVWESVVLVEGSSTFKAEVGSLMCRLNSLRSHHRVLMVRSVDFTNLHVTMNVLEFLKRSVESMRNLEARMLNLSCEEACMQTAALLAVVTMDYQFCEIALKDKSCISNESACMGVLHTARLLDLSEIVLASKVPHTTPTNEAQTKAMQSVFPESFDYASSRYVGLLQQLQALHNLYRAPLEETRVTA